MRLIKLIFTVMLLLAAGLAWGQTDSLRLQYAVHGKVSDARSGKGLPAVNIRVPGKNFATVSNAEGNFVIRSDQPVRELVFSYVGYKTLRVAVEGEGLKVRMQPDKYLLDASSIVSGDPKEIVESAILAVEYNYPLHPELLRSFYRETLQKRSRYISVSEAVARLWKSAYKWPVGADKAALDKSRIIMSQRKRDTLSVKLAGGPALAVTADPVKNTDMLFYDVDLGLYRFEMDQPEYIADRLQFVIHFSPFGRADYPLYCGTLYIDRETLAFTRIEASLDMSDPEKVTRQLLLHKPLGLRFTPREVGFTVSYKPGADGRYRMEYLRSVIRFDCDWKKRMFATGYTLVNETVVTDLVDPPVPIRHQEQFRPTDALSDKAQEFLDPAFWEGYNIIAPTESLEHAVGRLRKSL